VAFLLSTNIHAQQNLFRQQTATRLVEGAHPAGTVSNRLASMPIAVARETGASARDFVRFRDPQWSVLTIGQIGAGTADMVTSLNNQHSCPSCLEVGISRYFVGAHPDAHKYIIGGILEIGIEAVLAHYMRNDGPAQKKYWRGLWTIPQSLSLYGHARAANHNAALP
jgi:hypothetical protein